MRQNLSEVGINAEIDSADVAGWNEKTSQWDYDLAFTYLYQYGDPALGVSRNYTADRIKKGSPWNNVEARLFELLAHSRVARRVLPNSSVDA